MSETEQVSLVRQCDVRCVTKLCPRCKLKFCPHNSSKIDQQYCQYCFHDFYIEDSIIRRVEQVKSLKGNKLFQRVMRARLIVIKGQDWLFAQQRILELSDEDVAILAEYHRVMLGELLNEKEARKIAANKSALTKMIKGATLKIPSVKAGLNTDGSPIEVHSTTVTTTTVKRTRIPSAKTNNMQNAVTTIVNMLKAQGLTAEEITAKLTAMAGR